MSFSRVYSAQVHLLKGQVVTIEADISRGLHTFSIVGLGDKAVDESRDRVSSAIKNSGFASPKSGNQKIVISLSPADIKKEGSYFDLAIALAYLSASEEIAFTADKRMFLGELALNGELLPIKGALALAEKAKHDGFTELFVPNANKEEAALIDGLTVYGARTLLEVIDHINTKKKISVGNEIAYLTPTPKTEIRRDATAHTLGFEDIKGQESAKRGMLIAASGGHNIVLFGPPGTGKTMLARVFSQILPELSEEDVLEVTGIHSIAGTAGGALVTHPPFRAPHHTASYVSVIGGGTFPKPGEVTLAHKGVLFLDEFPEFEKRVIESLREPLEDNKVSISRARGTATFPSNFTLVAAMNPCPCGYYGSRQKECMCKPSDLDRYKRKLSGPIMDRIDLAVEVAEIQYETLGEITPQVHMETDEIRERVKTARARQEKRFKTYGRPIRLNSDMNVKDLEYFVPLTPDVRTLLNESAKKLGLSPRAYHRTIKLARTIADLDNKDTIEAGHILEAIRYRPKQ